MTTPRLARRSSLILPVNIPRFVERAGSRGADAIVLDLEDSVPAGEKAHARDLVEGAIPLAARGGDEPLTVEQFQRRLEEALPRWADAENSGKLDWFFDQWVHDTGIPRYRLQWRAAGNADDGWHIEGSVEQSEVSDLFTMPVPLYARNGARWSRLGAVVVTGPRVSFRLPVAAPPDEVALDPFGAVLFVSADQEAR